MYAGYYAPDTGAYDRGAWLQNRTAQERATQQSAMDRLKAYATGEQSMSRDIGERQTAAQRASFQGLAGTAQRGGRSAGAERAAAYQGDLAARGIGQQTDIAAKKEQAAAAKGYAGAAQSALNEQLELEKIARLYKQLGIQDREANRRAKLEIEKLRQARAAATLASQEAESQRLQSYISGGFGAGVGFLSGIGGMIGGA
jgi:hypothetical protein